MYKPQTFSSISNVLIRLDQKLCVVNTDIYVKYHSNCIFLLFFFTLPASLNIVIHILSCESVVLSTSNGWLGTAIHPQKDTGTNNQKRPFTNNSLLWIIPCLFFYRWCVVKFPSCVFAACCDDGGSLRLSVSVFFFFFSLPSFIHS